MSQQLSGGRTAALDKQRLGTVGTLVLINVVSMAPPLCTDMYSPAIPVMTQELATTDNLMSLTMTLFFLGMGIGMLLMGPISDKFGRRPTLIGCAFVSFLCSLGGVFVTNVWPLIVMRFIQAIAAGGMVTLGMALVRDCYEGEFMARMIAVVQAISMFAPAIAPILGVVTLAAAGWRAIMAVQAIILGLCVIGSFFLVETLEPQDRTQGSTFQAFGALVPYLKNLKMLGLLIMGGFMNATCIAYLSLSSYIYIDFFGTGETLYGIIFCITALFCVAACTLYARRPARNTKRAVNLILAGCAVSAVGLITIGQISFLSFMACMVLYYFVISYMRPVVSAMILMHAKEAVGAASAVINFAFNAIGCVGMVVASLGWANHVVALTAAMVVFTLASALIWALVNRTKAQ